MVFQSKRFFAMALASTCEARIAMYPQGIPLLHNSRRGFAFCERALGDAEGTQY
jgi:hypothetical protein